MSRTPWIKKHSFLIQLCVSAVLVGLVFAQIDLDRQVRAFRDFRKEFFFLAIGVELVLGYIYCYKWHMILKKMSMPSSPLDLFFINQISSFYALALPSRLTQDGVRLYKLTKGRAKKLTYLMSWLFDRGTGALGLFLCGAGALIFSRQDFIPPDLVRTSMALVAFVVVTVLVFLFAPVEKIFGWVRSGYGEEMRGAVVAVKQDRGFFVLLCVYSFFLHLIVPLSLWSLLMGFDAEISLINVVWIHSAVTFILLVPISVSGFGVREGFLIFVLGKFAVSPEQAVVVSLLTVMNKVVQGFLVGLPLDLFWLPRYYRKA